MGSFELDLPWELHDCRLLGRQNYSRDIGDVAAKGQIELDKLTTGPGSWFPEENYVARYREELLTGAQLAMADGLRYSNELLLVGFTEELERLAEFDRPHIQHTLSMVVVHLPCERRPSRSGQLRMATAEPLLIGGRNFSLREDYYNPLRRYAPELEMRRYEVAAGGYMEFRLDMQGTATGSQYIGVDWNVFEDNRDAVQISDVQQVLNVEGLGTEGRWIPLDIRAGTRGSILPIERLLLPDNTIHLRMRAIQEIQAQMPDVRVN